MTAFTSTSPTVSVQAAAKSTLSDRFILAQVKSSTLVIPAGWVSEIFQVQRSQILPMPFYNSSVIGLTHQGGRVLPLLSASSLLSTEVDALRETTMVIKLSDAAGALTQVGLVVDRIVGSQTRADLPSSVWTEAAQSGQPMVLFRPEQVDSTVWQPQSWGASNFQA